MSELRHHGTVAPIRRLAPALVAVVSASLLAAAPAHAGRTVTIRGGGWGHGIGMSQYGAYGRALNGKGAEAILEHYYTGTEVSQARMPARLRVGLLPNYGSSVTRISFSPEARGPGGDGRVVIKLAGAKSALAEGVQGDSFRLEATDTGGFRVFKNDVAIKSDGVSVFGGPDEPLVINYAPHRTRLDVDGKPYDYVFGSMEVSTYQSTVCGSFCARLVLRIPMQKYLYGLGEVPSSWPAAALEAQAIAGRTYAFEKVERLGQRRHPCACAVYDSTIDQAYIGDAKRTGSGEYWDDWKGAVDRTKDQVILYRGEPIQALYSSSSGGHTENNENVWGGSPIAYLRGVNDAPDAVEANPNHTWTVTMPWSQFSDELNARFGTGRVERFELVKPFGVSGRVTVVKSPDEGGVKIVGAEKTVRVSGWDVRGALGLKDTLFRVRISYSVGKRFAARYDELGGSPGKALSGTYPVPRGAPQALGRAQDFEVGRMTYVAATGKVVWQHGPVLERYDAAGREGSKLGLPTSDVWGPGSYLGARYANGAIYWSQDHGARVVRGPFHAAYRAAGGPKGALGLPISGRQQRPTLPGGARQRFEHGALYRTPDGEVFALWGKIAERYRELGEATSACGYPIEAMTGDESTASARFKGGTITWAQGSGVEVDCS
jgi:SpoIID/LytB domain protein